MMHEQGVFRRGATQQGKHPHSLCQRSLSAPQACRMTCAQHDWGLVVACAQARAVAHLQALLPLVDERIVGPQKLNPAVVNTLVGEILHALGAALPVGGHDQ